MAMTPAERQKRYRLGLPKLKPGPKRGFKQSADHIEKRKRFGSYHHHWGGKNISIKGGRTRAIRLYPKIGPCVLCGNRKAERHHFDENTRNNAPQNIIILCRKCHMQSDGRLERFRKLAIANQPKAVAARWC
jgi:hypothetical protein